MKKTLFFGLYILMWFCALFVFYALVQEGWHIDFSFAYGKIFSNIFRIVGLFVFLSFFYLQLILDNGKVKFAIMISFALSIAFFSAYNCLNKYASANAEFSTEKWIEYPQCRPAMFDDLMEKYEPLHCSENDIIKLLGEPNEQLDNNTYVYSDGKSNHVYIKFSNGIVTDCYLVD